MSLNFPNSPVNEQVFEDIATGNRYVYNSFYGVWEYQANAAATTISSIFTPLNANTIIYDLGSYMVDTSNGEVYITLPEVIEGGSLFIADSGGDKTVNNTILVSPNTSLYTINGSNTNFHIEVPNVVVELIYVDSDWRVFF